MINFQNETIKPFDIYNYNVRLFFSLHWVKFLNIKCLITIIVFLIILFFIKVTLNRNLQNPVTNHLDDQMTKTTQDQCIHIHQCRHHFTHRLRYQHQSYLEMAEEGQQKNTIKSTAKNRPNQIKIKRKIITIRRIREKLPKQPDNK